MKAKLSEADISADGLYRSWLMRDSDEPGTCVFVMLNPSTADATLDDPTIRRCKQFAAREGCGRLIVVNLFTFRATYPTDLINARDPIGPDADEAMERAANCLHSGEAARCIFGWGNVNFGPAWFRNLYQDRVNTAISKFEHTGNPKCFALNKGGSPKHPLYVSGSAPLINFPIERNFACPINQ